MKRFTTIMAVVLALCFMLLAVPAFANTTLVVPTGVYGAYDRDGNHYAVTSGTISVPAQYVQDFINAGYTKQTINAVLCGTSAACAGTNTVAKVYAGSVALIGASRTVTGLGFADTSYICTATDKTAANAAWASPSTASTLLLTGNGTDTINYICVGN